MSSTPLVSLLQQRAPQTIAHVINSTSQSPATKSTFLSQIKPCIFFLSLPPKSLPWHPIAFLIFYPKITLSMTSAFSLNAHQYQHTSMQATNHIKSLAILRCLNCNPHIVFTMDLSILTKFCILFSIRHHTERLALNFSNKHSHSSLDKAKVHTATHHIP